MIIQRISFLFRDQLRDYPNAVCFAKIARYAATTLALICIAISHTACLADVRPEKLREGDPGEAARESGIALLQASQRAAGILAWGTYRTASLEVRDSYSGLLGTTSNPWSANPVRYRHELLLGGFTSRLTLLDGPDAGAVLGVQDWKTYTQSTADPEADPVFAPDDQTRFILPGLQYFFEAPFRLQAAPIIEAAGEIEHDGITYDLVYATWGQREPNAEHDQYVIWLDREERLVRKLRYTAREAGGFMAATMHYRDFRNVGGVRLAFRQTITLAAPEDTAESELDAAGFHDIVIESAAFDRLPPEALAPGPGSAGGDFKP